MKFKNHSSWRGWLIVTLGVGFLTPLTNLQGADWARFRGPDGAGISSDTAVPMKWSDTENLKWKTELPGPGLSSPIVVGDKLFVTCYTGYGLDAEKPGNIANLTRHLVCLSRADGKILWTKSVASAGPEDKYEGFITEHGYASQSPVSDGRHVFVFFGKSGVLAFDLDGNQLWQTSVGTASGRMKWGSAASPILFENLVIVNASDESESLLALDKQTGKEVWRQSAPLLGSNWSTPVLVEGKEATELVLAVTGEVWGLDPATGKRKWHAKGFGERGYCTSLIAGDGIVYCAGGMLGGPSFAIRTGGSGDVTDSHVMWSGQSFEAIISPILHNARLWGSTNRGIAYGANAENGQPVFQARLATSQEAADQPAAGGARPAGQRGGPGGGEYASPILIGDKVYLITRAGTTYVIQPGDELQVLAKSEFTSDKSGFCATPAVSDGRLYIRSNKYLYCVASD